MIPCYCTDPRAVTCCGGGVTPRGRACVCRCHRDIADAQAIADAHRAAVVRGDLTDAADAALHLAWLRAMGGRDARGRAS